MKHLFAGAFALLVCISGANAEEDKEVSKKTVALAREYIEAYSTFDTANFGSYYTDDAVFTDPTSTDQDANGNPFVYKGKEAIIKALSDYAAKYGRFTLNYDVERLYESNGVVVFVAILGWDLETKDGRTANGSAPMVTAVTVKDRKIAAHTDYYDYQGNAVNLK